MSSLLYKHTIGGNGVGQGLPLRRASQLYDVEPDRRYPNVLSLGTHSDQGTYDRGIYRRVPHLPITFIIEPYVNNHKVGGGNFTRRQYFVIKRGQPLMAATKRDATIGMFSNAGAVTSKTYVDPANLERDGKLVGYTNGVDFYRLNSTATLPANQFKTTAEFNALPLITVADVAALSALALADITAADASITTDVGADGFEVLVLDDGGGDAYVYTYDQDLGPTAAPDAGVGLDGEWVKAGAASTEEGGQDSYTLATYYTVAEFDNTDHFANDAAKEGFRGVYGNLTDTNDKISTGGENMYAAFDEAIFGSTSLVKYVDIDADSFYFGGASRSEGFIFPSTGGAPRTIFFNEVDAEAAVTLPTDGTGAVPNIVTPIGNVTDVSVANAANWYKSAVNVTAKPTIGVAHTDLEQALSHKWHMFSTGTEPHSPVRKGYLTIPFLDIVKFKSIMAASAPGVTFAFTDETNNRSGLKVGLFGGVTITQNLQNKYSLLTSLDAGYANLYYNFAAPFLLTRSFPTLREQVVPDLFGNYVPFGSGILKSSATDGAGNDFALSNTDRTENFDGAVTQNSDHIVGRITNIYDIPHRAMINMSMNPIFQSRITDSSLTRDFSNEGYRRVRGADNAGLEPVLSDFLLMALGGSNYSWASSLMPKFDGKGQDLARVLEELVVQGAAGLVEISLNLVD